MLKQVLKTLILGWGLCTGQLTIASMEVDDDQLEQQVTHSIKAVYRALIYSDKRHYATLKSSLPSKPQDYYYTLFHSRVFFPPAGIPYEQYFFNDFSQVLTDGINSIPVDPSQSLLSVLHGIRDQFWDQLRISTKFGEFARKLRSSSDKPSSVLKAEFLQLYLAEYLFARFNAFQTYPTIKSWNPDGSIFKELTVNDYFALVKSKP